MGERNRLMTLRLAMDDGTARYVAREKIIDFWAKESPEGHAIFHVRYGDSGIVETGTCSAEELEMEFAEDDLKFDNNFKSRHP